MKCNRKISLAFMIGATGFTLNSDAVYMSFEGSGKPLDLQTFDELNNFYNRSTDLLPCFSNNNLSPLVDEYYHYSDFLKNYNTAEFIHIHPTWLLVSDSVLEKRDLQIGHTYQTNPLDFLSPKFKVEEIQPFTYDTSTDKNEIFRFSLVKISKGDELTGENPIDLVDQPPIMLFTGDSDRIKIVEEIYNKLDNIISVLEAIKDDKPHDKNQLSSLVSEIMPLIGLLELAPGIGPVVKALTLLKTTLAEIKPIAGKIYDDLIELRPEFRARTIRFELAQSLNDHQIFLASPYSHTVKNELIFEHQYTPALCRLNAGGTAFGKDFRQFFKGLFKKDHGATLNLHMVHKSHSIFAHETKDTVPFEFLTMPGEDTGQPIFAYNQKTNEYSIISINQVPKGHISTAPVLFHPNVIQWMIKTIKDDFIIKKYPLLVKLAGLDLEKSSKQLDNITDLNIFQELPSSAKKTVAKTEADLHQIEDILSKSSISIH